MSASNRAYRFQGPITSQRAPGMTIGQSVRRLGRAGFVCGVVLVVASCEAGLTENPPHIIVADNLYVDAAGFEAGLNALYAQVRLEREGVVNSSGAGSTNELYQEITNVGVDNAYANYPADLERLWNDWGVRNNPQQGFYLDVWTWLYRTINAANTLIGRAENPAIPWTEAEKNRTVAQARLIRAWAYRHLDYNWGAVPLNLQESTGETVRTDWERTPRQQVREQIEKDLLFAEQHLPATSPTAARVSKAVARHYLAELYLAMGQPAKAEEKAEAVLNGGEYRLVTARYGVRANQPGVAFMDQFVDGNVNRNQGNTEVLWALQSALDVPGAGSNIMRRYWVNRYYNIRGVQVSAEYGGRAIGRLANTAWSINAYEPRDDRGSYHSIRKFYLYNDAPNVPRGSQLGDTIHLIWTTERQSNPNWPSTRKWDWASPNDVSEARQFGDQPYLRLAETYLLAAEAEFRQGKLAEAAQHINVVRQRANATPITAAQVTLDFILDERSRELLTEEHRRYTLLRTGTWLDRTRRFNPLARPNIAPRDTILPIPQAVIDANIGRRMPQNPGY